MPNALTYNMSFATQINKAIGSEKDFVEACQRKYKKGGIQCTKNAVSNIAKLPLLDIVGLQEVNSDVEKQIMKVQPNLTKFKRGKAGKSTVSIIWNPDIFGHIIFSKVFNLAENDSRPCLIVVMKKKQELFVIINVHMPHNEDVLGKIYSIIDKNMNIREAIFNPETKMIMFGDFNDGKTTIHKDRPFKLKYKNKTVRLKYNKTRKEARKTMRSCCWHKPKHKYKYFSNTGDYILVNKNIKQQSINIPSIFKTRGRNNRLFSDHMPVFAELIL